MTVNDKRENLVTWCKFTFSVCRQRNSKSLYFFLFLTFGAVPNFGKIQLHMIPESYRPETLTFNFFFLPVQKKKVGREREIREELKELKENFAREEDSFLPA